MRTAPKHRQFNHKWIGLVLAGMALLWATFTAYKINNESVFLNRDWQVAVVFATQPLTALTLSQNSAEPIVVTLPNEVYIDVPFGYGQYRIEAVADLAKLEKKGDLLAQSISDVLNLPVVGWVTKSTTSDTSQNELTRLQNSFSWTSIFTEPAFSNFKWWDRVILKWKLSRTRSVRTVNLNNYPAVMQQFQLGDHTQAERFNREALIGILLPIFEDPEVRQENISVEVFNTTDEPLIGEKFARYVSLVGGKVIGIKNDNEAVENCVLQSQKRTEKSKLVRFITREFGCNVTIDSTIGVDLQIKVGDTWATRWRLVN